MRYYATASGPRVRDAMRQGLIGMIATPAAGNAVMADVDWCADNAAFTGGYPGDVRYLDWLDARAAYASACRFVVAPDVPFDAAGTLARSTPMFDPIHDAGYRVGFAAQNGAELPGMVPWSEIDCLFLAGDTEWKLGPDARRLTARARDRGLWVHMGRVNSVKRLRYAADIGCDSADGTYLAFGPDINLARLLGWLRRLENHPTVFDVLRATEGVPA